MNVVRRREIVRALLALMVSALLFPTVFVSRIEARSTASNSEKPSGLFQPSPLPSPLAIGTTVSITLEPGTVVSGITTAVIVSGKLSRTDTGAGVDSRVMRLDWPTGNTSLMTGPNGNYSYSLGLNITEDWVFQITFSGDATYSQCWNSQTLLVEKPPAIRPSLAGWEMSKTGPRPGEIITLLYGVNNPASSSTSVGLQASIRKVGTTQELTDPTRDKIVSVAPGYNWYSREFKIPELASGSYDIALTIWSGEPEESIWLDSTGWLMSRLTILLPELQISPLTVSPSSGDTLSEFSFSTAVKGGSSSYTVYLRNSNNENMATPQSGGPATYTFKNSFSVPGSYYAHILVVDTLAAASVKTNEVRVLVNPIATKKPEIIEFAVPGDIFKAGDAINFRLAIKNNEDKERKYSIRLTVSVHGPSAIDQRVWDDYEIFNAKISIKAAEIKRIPIKWTIPQSVWPGTGGVTMRLWDEGGNLLIKLEEAGFLIQGDISYVELDGTDNMTLAHVHLNTSDMKVVRYTETGQDFSLNREDVVALLGQSVVFAKRELKPFLDGLSAPEVAEKSAFLPAHRLADGSGGFSILYSYSDGTMRLSGTYPSQVAKEYRERRARLERLGGSWWEIPISSLLSAPAEFVTKIQPALRLSPLYAALYTVSLAHLYPENLKALRGDQFFLSLLIDPRDHGISRGEVKISFDPAAFEIRDAAPGPLLGTESVVVKKELDISAGNISISIARNGRTATPTNADYLVRLLFEVRRDASAGRYPITISKITLADEDGQEISRIEVRDAFSTLGGKEGDLDVNGTVDSRDLAIFAAAYGKSRGKEGFNPALDLNHDGYTDYRDLAILGANYGG